MQPISIQRIWLLVQRMFLLRGRSWLVYLGPLLAILFLAWSTSHDSNSNPSYFNSVYTILLVVAGFFQATITLSENKTADGRQSSLTLPASDTEKFIGAWLYSGPIFLVLFTIAFLILTWVVTGVLGIFGIGEVVPFDLSQGEIWKAIKTFFFIAQPLGLLAAIAFNRFAAGKLFGYVMGIVGILAALTVLTVRIVYRHAFTGFFTPNGVDNINIGNPEMALSSDSPLLLLLAFGLTILAATYFKFQEKSV